MHTTSVLVRNGRNSNEIVLFTAVMVMNKGMRTNCITFTFRSLAYLTASKNGLSDVELEDVLSLDDVVLNDVFQHWLPPVRRIPPLLIPRLQDELSSYVMQREANETVVFYWYHSQFISVARQRYLDANEMHRREIHCTLAHYYLGTWGGGKKKPFKFSQKQLSYLSQRGKRGGGSDDDDLVAADRKVCIFTLLYHLHINKYLLNVLFTSPL